MLINKVELNRQDKLPIYDPLEAYDPELRTCQKLFARRDTHYSESLDALDKVENVNEVAYCKSAVSDPSDSIVLRLLPGVRCSP